MHVLLLNQAFFPDVVATAQMSKDLADHLVAHGHQVTAVASRSIYGKSGATLPKRETIGGVEVRRVGFSLFGKAGYAARIADFGFFYVLALLKVIFSKKADVIVCFTTPPFIGLVGILARVLRGSKAVYWVMDLYPDLPVACGVMKPRGVSTRFFERVNRFILRHSNVDVVLGRCMQERVVGKGIPAEKVALIPVWSSERDVAPVAHETNPYRSAWGLEGKFAVVYSGNFGIGHDAGTICAAMERLKDDAHIRFVFVGGGKRRKEVEAFIAAKGLTNAQWKDYQPREKLNESLSAADLHLISLREGVEGIMVPSKLFGIMAAGRPSIFVGNPTSEIARVLTEHGCGVVVREGDGAGLAEAIRGFAANPEKASAMGGAARRALIGRYDMETACTQWRRLLESLVARRTPAPNGSADARRA